MWVRVRWWRFVSRVSKHPINFNTKDVLKLSDKTALRLLAGGFVKYDFGVLSRGVVLNRDFGYTLLEHTHISLIPDFGYTNVGISSLYDYGYTSNGVELSAGVGYINKGVCVISGLGYATDVNVPSGGSQNGSV